MRGRRGFLRLAGTGLLGGAVAVLDPLALPAGAGPPDDGFGPGDGYGATASAPISSAKVVVPMVFPVLGGASYSDTFLACRSGCSRKHLGQDLMGPKMRPLVATFDGTVTSMRTETSSSSGNYLCITSHDGWTANYLHVNNDTPGTDDGRGTARWAFMPGIRLGAPVFAGQQIAWLGDSGNAESSGAHLHFELRKGSAWSGTVYNAKPSLDKAARLTRPRTGGPHPDGVVVQVGAGWTTWLLEGGHRRRLLPQVFKLNGHDKPGAVVRVQAGEINHYPAGPDVPLRDGLLVRGPDNRVWVVAAGARIHVPSAAAAAALGVEAAAVPRVDAQVLGLTPEADDQTLPGVVRPGALLREDGTAAVWLVTAIGTRRWVPDAITLASWGYSRAQVQVVQAGTLDTVVTGAPLLLRDGTLFRSPTGSLFVVSGGRRRYVPSKLVLDTFGYTATPVTVNGTIMARLPSGADLP